MLQHSDTNAKSLCNELWKHWRNKREQQQGGQGTSENGFH